MQKEINIAAILKDKPEDTKLWSPIFGEVLFTCVNNTNKDSKISIIVRHRGYTEEGFFCDGRFDESGERLLFPSKSMLDWSKFAWKKGDVLISKDTDSLCVFDSFGDDTYSTFNVKYYNKPLYLSFDLGVISRATEPFTKVDDDEAKNFIRKIEEHYGGKLNHQTLEIEKPEFQFKDGDILTLSDGTIFINKDISNSEPYGYVVLFENGLFSTISQPCTGDSGMFATARFATDSEKQKLFTALAKEGKCWNSETKQIEDLPKKCELKPFDKVLVRDDLDYHWRPYFFYKVDSDKDYPYTMVNGEVFSECIPYNEQTKHLLGTTDDWKGGKE